MELGGSDPYLILDDADLEVAVNNVVISRINNNGQVCIAAKRIIVDDKIYPKFQDLLLAKLESYKMGDPFDESCNLGPLAREDLRRQLDAQVRQSINLGANCILGGKIPDGSGFYYPITVLADVAPGMSAYDEELFGPVISLIRVQDENEAIAIANDTKYGLAAAVFTKDIARGERVAKLIESGSCYVNKFVSSNPLLPFGGIKTSGYGRELAAEGSIAFTNVKTIAIA